jgi:hypothetical protein
MPVREGGINATARITTTATLNTTEIIFKDMLFNWENRWLFISAPRHNSFASKLAKILEDSF